MNPTGSEFTLRVAICDLVERLKRMQHKCSYLEECRNQLVKEVIRLRLQNDWLGKQINDSPAVSSSLPQNLQCFCNQQSLVNSPYHAPHCQLNTQDVMSGNDNSGSKREADLLNASKHFSSNKPDESLNLINILNEFDQEDGENKQDSIKQLTIQMLKDLDIEIKTGRLKSDLITLVKSSSVQPSNGDNINTDLMKFDEDESVMTKEHNQSNSTNFEAFNNNSDYYSNSHNLNVPLEDLHYSQHVVSSAKNNNLMDMEESPINDSKTNSETIVTRTVGDKSNLPFLNNIHLISKEEELVDIIVAVKNDLINMHQGILASTDKLNKIKSKQLRHYFQKQINLDNSSNNNNNKQQQH